MFICLGSEGGGGGAGGRGGRWWWVSGWVGVKGGMGESELRLKGKENMGAKEKYIKVMGGRKKCLFVGWLVVKGKENRIWC